MESARIKLLEKFQKKTDTLINDLTLLQDAQKYYMQNTGEDVGVCTQLASAISNLGKESYNMLMAIASAEGEEVVGQMKMDLQRFEEAAQE